MSLLSTLTSIGFTEYEAKVYVELLANHPATGYQISKQAGIPRSMVYEALGRLHARGAVLSSSENRSILYRPLPPDTLLDRIEQEQRTLVNSLRLELQQRYQSVPEGLLWSLTGRNAILAYARDMLESAQHELMLVLTDADSGALNASLVASNQRGVELRLLLTGSSLLAASAFPTPDSVQIAHHPPLESELQQLWDLFVIVADGKECLIGQSDPARAATPEQAMTAAVTNHRNLVYLVRQFIWMELFTQRLSSRLGPDLLAQLTEEDRKILENKLSGKST